MDIFAERDRFLAENPDIAEAMITVDAYFWWLQKPAKTYTEIWRDGQLVSRTPDTVVIFRPCPKCGQDIPQGGWHMH